MNAKTRKKIRDVRTGQVPTLKESIAQVLGSKTLHLDQIITGLEKRGRAPDSKNPRKYVGETLARHDDFEHVGDSNYKARLPVKTKAKKNKTNMLSVLLPNLRETVGAAAKAEGKTIQGYVTEIVEERLNTKPPAPGSLRFTFDVDPGHVRGLKALAYIEGKTEHEIVAQVLLMADRALSHLINTTVESLKVPEPAKEAPKKRALKVSKTANGAGTPIDEVLKSAGLEPTSAPN